MRMTRLLAALTLYGMGVFLVVSTTAQTTNLTITRVGAGFQLPVFATSPPGDTNRLFILEQHTGRIRILYPSSQAIEEQPFLTVSNITRGGEQGLLGLAFHPNYQSNGWFFVNFTGTGGGPAGHTEIARFTAQGDPVTSNVADPASKKVILTFPQPESNHNGGWIGFGLDGYLYISTGDGGGGDDRHGAIGNGQNLNSLLGKILRINVDEGDPYAIPPTNPFVGATDREEEIWAFGLRNPWRSSIDRETGDLWIGDVGQRTREEIDFNPAGVGGLNFGWRPREGAIQNPTFPSETPVTPAVDPVHDYGRNLGFSVTGGYVYRGQDIPSLQGFYIFADYGSSRFWTFRGTNKLDLAERTAELNRGSPRPIGNVSAFGEDARGELYICDLDDGEIYKIVPPEPPVMAGIRLTALGVLDSVFTFSFQGQPAATYTIEASDSVLSTNWQAITNLTATPTSTNLMVSDPVTNTQKFYRVRSQ